MIAGGIALTVATWGAGAPLATGLFGGAITASTLSSIGIVAGMAGVFGLLQSVLNPADTSVAGSQQNAQGSATFRRVIYGVAEVGGVLTYDSAPAGNNGYQNVGPTANWRHQVYTIAGHEITSFGRNGIPCVVIDNVLTTLSLDPSTGYYFPTDESMPFGGQDGPHIGFEFDIGNPTETKALSALSAACPDWVPGQCIQRGRAKVHVAMRYDCTADGTQVGNSGSTYSSDLQTSIPIYVNGSVPTFRFPVIGKPILDTRTNTGDESWHANTEFGFAEFILDPSGRVEVQLNGPGSFRSGSSTPAWPVSTAYPGATTPDNQCDWLNAGKVQAGGWPGPNRTIPYPYVFTDPNGNLQFLQYPTGAPTGGSPLGTFTTGPTEPEWASQAGQETADGTSETQGVTGVDITDGGFGYGPYSFPVSFSGGGGRGATGHTLMIENRGGPHNGTYSVVGVIIDTPGYGYTSSPTLVIGGNATGNAVLGSVTGGIPWLCINETSFANAANPSNPALIIYDYLTNAEYGEAADPSTIDIDSINAAANICEEQVVVYIGSNGGSVSENLYSCDGLFDQSTARGDVLKALVASMAGTLVPPGDLWHLFAGAYTPPTANLTDDDLRDSIKGDFRISRRDICNGVKGTFLPSFLPTNTTEVQPAAWRFTDFPPYQGNGLQGHPNYITEDGGQVIWKEIRLGFTTSIWMAQRLAKIVLQLLRFQVTLQLACKLTAFPIQAGDVVSFTHARWAALPQPPPTVFFVTQATMIVESNNGVPVLGVDLVLREFDPSIYAFTAPSSFSNQGEYSQYGTLGTIGG